MVVGVTNTARQDLAVHHPTDMRLAPAAAIGVALVLGAGSVVLVGHEHPELVLAGSVGLVLGTAMLAMTALVAWWRIGVEADVTEPVAPGIAATEQPEVEDGRLDVAA